MKRISIRIGLLFALLFFAASAQAENDLERSLPAFGNDAVVGVPAMWGALNAHDPAIFRDGDTYYVFSTDASRGDVHPMGVQVRTSLDLIHWTYRGTAFANYRTDCAKAIDLARLDPDRHNGLWAPDVVKVGDVYRMYYSASTFGSSRSCIGLAEADHPMGPYTDRGIVVQSDANALNGPNCIDAALITAQDGRSYLSYGSFFGGIFLAELGADGFLAPDAEPKRIAGSRGSSIEGSYLVYLPQTEYYYLFVSYASLSKDYNVRVGRSRNVAGPYLDARGRDLTGYATINAERVGTKLLGGFRFHWNAPTKANHGVMAPGHCSVLVEGNDMFLVHHQRTYDLDHAWFGMCVRRMALNAYGWPVVLPMTYTGESLQPLDELPEGEYALIAQAGDNNAQPHESVTVTLRAGEITGAATGTYRLYDGWRVAFTIDGVTYDGVVARQTDAEQGFTGIGLSLSSEEGMSLLAFTQY